MLGLPPTSGVGSTVSVYERDTHNDAEEKTHEKEYRLHTKGEQRKRMRRIFQP